MKTVQLTKLDFPPLMTAATLALLACVSAQVHAQSRADIVNNPKLFLQAAVKVAKWNEPAEPVKIVGLIYFVGTKGLSVWLITTSEGHILPTEKNGFSVIDVTPEKMTFQLFTWRPPQAVGEIDTMKPVLVYEVPRKA